MLDESNVVLSALLPPLKFQLFKFLIGQEHLNATYSRHYVPPILRRNLGIKFSNLKAVARESALVELRSHSLPTSPVCLEKHLPLVQTMPGRYQ